MRYSTRRLPHWWIGGGVLAAAVVAASVLLAPPAPLSAQEDAGQAFTVRAHKYAFEPARLEVHQDDLVKITLRAEDIPHSFTVDAYRISKHHLARVVHTLAARGYVEVTPGRAGGVRLKREPSEIRLGTIIRDAESTLALVECFDGQTNTCPIVANCRLKDMLGMPSTRSSSR